MSNTHFLYTWVVIVYRCIISFIGIPGNVLILAVYWKKRSLGSAQVFIQTLALSDLYVCFLFAIDVHYWWYQFEYTNDLLCKIYFTLTSVGWYFSVSVTVAIAIDRWLAVCKPVNGRWSRLTAQKVSILCLVVALIVNVAVPFSSHVDLKEIPYAKNGTTCYKQAPSAGEVVTQKIMYFLVIIPQYASFLVAASLMCFLYFRLWRAVSRQGKNFSSGGAKVVPLRLASSVNGESTERTELADDVSQTQRNNQSNTSNGFREEVPTSLELDRTNNSLSKAGGIEVNDNCHPKGSVRKTEIRVSQKRSTYSSPSQQSMTRLSLMLILATAIFLFTWILTIVIFSLTSLTDKYFGNSIFYAAIAVLRLSTLVNNAINPILYSFLNPRFRADCVLLFKRLGGRFRQG